VRRAPAEDEVEGQDDEFLFRLTRGADLLAKGDLEAARAALGRARELRPTDPQVLGLLGQSLYKLGRFDDAAELYELLVEESPIEAAARVNLGLANLRAKRYERAIRELEIALDLNPEHKKAMGYLGLAYLEQGDVPRAREWFVRAGGEQMIAKCDELLALGRAQAPVVLADAGQAGDDAPPAAPSPAPEPAATPPPLPKPARLAGFATPAFAAQDGVAFAVSERFLTVAVSARGVLARAEGLLASQGDVQLAAEPKRFRGKATEKPFGAGARTVLRASGEGALLYARGAARLTVLALEGDAAYFREEAVFAFDGAMGFENGRVASAVGPDLDLVHLRGDGAVVLETRGDVAAVDVTAGVPVRVRADALVGWAGALTPQVAALASAPGSADGEHPGATAVVELSGSGRVLLDAGATSGR
jgi:uncharacterized protein (AIM24 family)